MATSPSSSDSRRVDVASLRILGRDITARHRGVGYAGYVTALVTVGICAIASWALRAAFSIDNSFLVFLLGIAVVAVRHGTGPTVLTAVCSVAVLAFFFMPPILSLAVADIQHLFTLAVLLTIGIVISSLSGQILHHAVESRRNAARFEALYRLSRELADLAGSEHLARAGVKHIEAVLDTEAVVLFPEKGRGFRPVPAAAAQSFRNADWAAVRAAFESQQPAGAGTYASSNATLVFVPLTARLGPLGVLGVRPAGDRHQLDDEQRDLLTTLSGQLSGALERDRLSWQVQSARNEVETERMRSALLSSVSHDLRTPLAVIAGFTGSLLDEGVVLTSEQRREMCRSVLDNANRLSRIVDNLLNMTRIESGLFRAVKQSHVLEEVVGSTLHRMAEELDGRPIETRLPSDLPLVPIDDVLFQQVLMNLLDNANKYIPRGMPIEIAACSDGNQVTIEVADRGPGLPAGEEDRVFEKFYRGRFDQSAHRGTGLGLTICRAVIAAHGGTIDACNRPGGGALFRMVMPLESNDAPATSNLPPVGGVEPEDAADPQALSTTADT